MRQHFKTIGCKSRSPVVCYFMVVLPTDVIDASRILVVFFFPFALSVTFSFQRKDL